MRRPRRAALALAAAVVVATSLGTGRARADDDDHPFEHRGIRRGGIVLFATGASAVTSSLALYETTDHTMGREFAALAISGHVMMAFGIPMWIYGAKGRRTRPRNRKMMLVGMGIAGLGFIALPALSGVFLASWQPGISDRAAEQRRVGVVVGDAIANSLLGVGIPLWAYGAASPDDWRADVEPTPARGLTIDLAPFGVRGTF